MTTPGGPPRPLWRPATKLAERGLGLLNGEPAERRRRLEELHDLTAFDEQESPAL